MALKKVRVSELPVVSDIDKFQVFGWDTANGSARALMGQLKGNVGKTPNVSLYVTALPHGSSPSVGKTGTAENPVFTIGFPLAKDGEKAIFRKDSGWLQWKLESESAWTNLVSLAELELRYDELTPEQIENLQAPAKEAANRLDSYITTKNAELDAVKNAAVSATAEATKQAGNAATAAATALAAASNADSATLAANTATATANASATAANDAADLALKAESNANIAAGRADTAANRSNDLSDHRDKIQDGYWWRWNESTKVYESTGQKAHGNVMYATFHIDEGSKKLYMYTPDGYEGASFVLRANKLYVQIN